MIRDATPDDLPAMVAIYNAAIAAGDATADTEPLSLDSRHRWLAERSFETRPVWLCEASGVVAAWLAFQDFHGRPAYHPTAEIAFYVAARFRRRGLGAALLGRAMERAPTLGLSTLLGFVFASNRPSVALLDRCGFREWGRLPRVARMPDGERDVLILGRHVARGEAPRPDDG